MKTRIVERVKRFDWANKKIITYFLCESCGCEIEIESVTGSHADSEQTCKCCGKKIEGIRRLA